MADIEYEEWADLVLDLAVRHGFRGGRLLDLGCGTGNATAPMLRRGYAVEGLDASPAMLAVARRKLPEVVFTEGSFEAFDIGRRFALVYSVFDSLNNLLSDAAFDLALRRVHAHLEPGGVLVFDVNTSQGLRDLWQGGVASGWADDVYYRWAYRYDEESGLATVAAYCETPTEAFTEHHQERGYDEPDLRRLLSAAGYVDVDVLGADARPAASDEPRVWVAARRPGP